MPANEGQQSHYFETWANRGEWASSAAKRIGEINVSKGAVTETLVMGNTFVRLHDKKRPRDRGRERIRPSKRRNCPVQRHAKTDPQRLGRQSHVRAIESLHGLGAVGCAVLSGGCTPFILRHVPGTEQQYSLVGEAYIYRIIDR